ncbi:MAG: 30S ribosomal protein S20 [Candidatus Daviesbacteria bacterium]|nr:30S ribosomal protein S20 [Candidatus Daviesbacteria bacterium]
MPIIKSAIKKVRKDKTRTARNKKREAALKALIKKVRTSKTAKDLQATFSALDKAAKVHLIHPNKSARLKSRLSKLISQGVNIAPKKSVKKTPVKKAK